MNAEMGLTSETQKAMSLEDMRRSIEIEVLLLAQEGGDDSLGATCDSTEDCGEEEVCFRMEVEDVDEEHETYTEDGQEYIDELFPLGLCVAEADCDKAIEDA